MTWFSPTGLNWTFADRKLIAARLITLWILHLIPLGVILMPSDAPIFSAVRKEIIFGLVILAGIWQSVLVVRQVTIHSWAERDDDLIIRRGRLFRKVTLVPYGRMQYVEVSAGPLDRMLGLTKIQIHTAAVATDATLSGVPADAAEALRDRLTALGESKLAGL